MKKNVVKVGLVGLGDHMLQSHLALLKDYDNVLIVGAFDPSEKSFERVQKEYNLTLKSFPSYEALLLEVDAIFISTPDRFHFSQMKLAVEAEKHVFCEKPLCINEEETLGLAEILKIAKEKKLVVSSCHPRRYDLPYSWVKENLVEFVKRYGKVMNVKLDFTYHKPALDKAQLHGGSMRIDHVNHEIDYINFLFGISEMKAWQKEDTFDFYEMAGKRKDGISFDFFGTRRLDGRIYDESIVVRFERATLTVYTKSSGSNIYDHETGEKIDIKVPKTDYDLRFAGINKNFISTILGEEECYLTHEDLLLNSKFSIHFDRNEYYQ